MRGSSILSKSLSTEKLVPFFDGRFPLNNPSEEVTRKSYESREKAKKLIDLIQEQRLQASLLTSNEE